MCAPLSQKSHSAVFYSFCKIENLYSFFLSQRVFIFFLRSTTTSADATWSEFLTIYYSTFNFRLENKNIFFVVVVFVFSPSNKSCDLDGSCWFIIFTKQFSTEFVSSTFFFLVFAPVFAPFANFSEDSKSSEENYRNFIHPFQSLLNKASLIFKNSIHILSNFKSIKTKKKK